MKKIKILPGENIKDACDLAIQVAIASPLRAVAFSFNGILVNAAKERNLAIEKQEAQAAIDLTKKKNDRLLAEADYQIEITRAKAIRDKNKIIGDGVTPELIELRRLEVLEKMAENESAVFMPVEAMSSPGAQIRMFAK